METTTSLERGGLQPVPLFAVIVLYRCRLEDSSAFRSLAAAARQASHRLSVLVWDNTPESDVTEFDLRAISNVDANRLSVQYHRAPDNPGLAMAYNVAVDRARSQGRKWLLTLDQDSVLPENYLVDFENEASDLGSSVAMCVPIVIERDIVCSPVRCALGLPWFFLKWSKRGTTAKNISAINSAAFVRVEAIDDLGGYSETFALDYLDHWLCRTLHQRGYLFHVLGSTIEHRLSVNSFASSVSTDRYRGILAAQRIYAMTDKSRWPTAILLLVLPLHAFRKFLQGAGCNFVMIAFAEWWLLVKEILNASRGNTSYMVRPKNASTRA